MHPTLSLKPILNEAWSKVYGSKKSFFALFSVLGVVQLLSFSAESLVQTYHLHIIFNFLLCIVSILISSPLITGFYMFGVKRSHNEPILAKMGFDYYHKAPHLFLAQCLMSATLWIIMFALTFTGIEFLSLARFEHSVFIVTLFVIGLIGLTVFLSLVSLFSFVFILIADQNLSFWQAYKTSVKKALPHLKTLLAAEFIFILLHLAAMIPLGIGLLWTMPFSYITTGIFYREIFKKPDVL